jgi:hypothetical protein
MSGRTVRLLAAGEGDTPQEETTWTNTGITLTAMPR